ncbi:MAG: hypothetical protein ABI969_16155, partial [bacterium]
MRFIAQWIGDAIPHWMRKVGRRRIDESPSLHSEVSRMSQPTLDQILDALHGKHQRATYGA